MKRIHNWKGKKTPLVIHFVQQSPVIHFVQQWMLHRVLNKHIHTLEVAKYATDVFLHLKNVQLSISHFSNTLKMITSAQKDLSTHNFQLSHAVKFPWNFSSSQMNDLVDSANQHSIDNVLCSGLQLITTPSQICCQWPLYSLFLIFQSFHDYDPFIFDYPLTSSMTLCVCSYWPQLLIFLSLHSLCQPIHFNEPIQCFPPAAQINEGSSLM